MEIRIGHLKYKVRMVDKDVMTELGKFGDCCVNTQVIRIMDGLTPEKHQETLMHEILHACYWNQGLDDKSSEEQVVSGLARALIQLKQDNPDLCTM